MNLTPTTQPEIEELLTILQAALVPSAQDLVQPVNTNPLPTTPAQAALWTAIVARDWHHDYRLHTYELLKDNVRIEDGYLVAYTVAIAPYTEFRKSYVYFLLDWLSNFYEPSL